MTTEKPDPEQDLKQAWQDIISNYGERIEITKPPVIPAPESSQPEVPEPIVESDPLGEVFVPPKPGPHALPEPRRRLAWFGVLGIPAFLLICILARIQLPGWTIGICATWFVGGFIYLVATMDPTRRHDGPDDGAVV